MCLKNPMAAASSEAHLWLTNPGSNIYKYFVAAVSNIRWPLASVLPQVAVCGFFRTLPEAQAYQAAHQKYKPIPPSAASSIPALPQGPIYLALETARLFPLAASPQRLFGADAALCARKRDAILRNYYRVRQLDKDDVASRKGREDEVTPTTSKADIEKDKRLKRTIQRRARRHAWELLQRVRAQKDKVERAKVILQAKMAAKEMIAGGAGAGAGAGEAGADAEEELREDEEMRDFLASLSDAQRASLLRSQKEDVKYQGEEEEEEDKEDGPVAVARAEIEVAKNTKLGTLDDYLVWAENHFRRQGIVPSSEEMMDEEEKEEELAQLAKIHRREESTTAAAAAAAASTSDSLPPPPDPSQVFCIGTIFYDTTGDSLNKAMPEAAGKEHVVTFFEPHASAESARSALENTYKNAFTEEKVFYVRVGQWCCFDHVTEDDGEQIYREEMVEEMFKGHVENGMLKFVEESLSHRPDLLPIPTTE